MCKQHRDRTPILSPDGVFFCSPACGGGKFCRKEWHDAAVKASDALAARLGRGWRAAVHENLGWHYHARNGRMVVHANEDKHAGFGPDGYPVESYTVFLNIVDRQFIASAGDPEDAVGLVTQDARTFVSNITAELSAILGDDPDPVKEAAAEILPEILDVFGTFFETFRPDAWTEAEYPEVARADAIFKRLHAAGYRRAP